MYKGNVSKLVGHILLNGVQNFSGVYIFVINELSFLFSPTYYHIAISKIVCNVESASSLLYEFTVF